MGEMRPSTVLKVDPSVKESIRMGAPQLLPHFNEKRVVVTGASSGVGRAVAMWLLNSGAHVALIGRDLEGLIHIGKQFPKQALVIRCDLSKDDQPYDMANTVLKEFGGVDMIVNTAGKRLKVFVLHFMIDNDFLILVYAKISNNRFLSHRHIKSHVSHS